MSIDIYAIIWYHISVIKQIGEMYIMNKNTPEGTRDLLFSEAELYDKIITLLSENYELAGFQKVATPVFENYELIQKVNRSIEQEDLYKLTDNFGHLMAVRPDNTIPIARIAATKLKNEPMPQKLYYNQNIYRINSDYSGKRNEILQSGVELIGSSGLKSDLLCIMLALDTLKSLNLKYKLEIGHVGYFNSMLNELSLSEDEAATLRYCIEMKNFVRLNGYEKILQNNRVRKIPLLYGGAEVLGKAKELANKNENAISSINYVRKVYEMLSSCGYEDQIMIDMGIVHKYDYYTGIVFRGYVEGAGEPVLKGGRYDNLISAFGEPMPANGFAINVCAVADAIIKKDGLNSKKNVNAIVHYDESTLKRAIEIKSELIKKHISCELSCFDDPEETYKYAEIMNIPDVIDLTEGKIGGTRK